MSCLGCIDKLRQDGIYEWCQTHKEEAMREFKKKHPKEYAEFLIRNATF